VQININKTTKTVLAIAAVILTLTGTTLAVWLKKGGDVLKSPKEIERVETKVDTFYKEFQMYQSKVDGLIEHIFTKVHRMEDVEEMDFYFGRSMTDPFNDKKYEIFNEADNKLYNVEIRENNEGKLFGFVYGMNIKYTLYTDTDAAIIRYYVMLHDIGDDENKSTYLEEVN